MTIEILAGAIYGVTYTFRAYLERADTQISLSPKVVEGLCTVVLLPLVLHLCRRLLNEKVLAALLGPVSRERFARMEPFSYLIWLSGGGFLVGMDPSIPMTLAVFVVFGLIQIGIFGASLSASDRREIVIQQGYVAFLFLISGFSALIYQVAWQRSLASLFGVNSESVTVIVSVFMLGLGVGALIGGYLQKHFPSKLLVIFLLLEVGIGIFGLASMDIIHGVGQRYGAETPLSLAFVVYAILVLPTLMMGATLPILISYLQEFFRNLGRATSLLYALNTFGSAIAAFATVEILFVFLGLKATVVVAAAFNLVTSLLIFHSHRVRRSAPPRAMSVEPGGQAQQTRQGYSFRQAFLILALMGFIALSQEILWFRVLGFLTGGKPQVFGLLLTATLLGIAVGALKAKRLCDTNCRIGAHLSGTLLLASALFYLSIPALALLSDSVGRSVAIVAAYGLIGVVAYASGLVFPVMIQVADTGKGGPSQRVSWLYFANIVGASVGPLFTGFLMLEWLSLRESVLTLTILTVVTAFVLARSGDLDRIARRKQFLRMTCFAVLIVFLHPFLFTNYLEKLQFDPPIAVPFRQVVENRSGIISVDSGTASHTVYGGGVYDGTFNVNPAQDTNEIARAYMMAALHRNPVDVLEIGLSSGSWASVIASYSALKKLTVVEINRGYQQVIGSYPEIAKVLTDPKVKLVHDDGRRWLRNNPDAKFDFIVMNTTFHWRNNASNLLSQEFLLLCRKHLNPGGVIYFNTTGSMDAAFTAAKTFRHVTRFRRFVAASDSPFDMTHDEKRTNFLRFTGVLGHAVFETDAKHLGVLNQLVGQDLPDFRSELASIKGLHMITDDNMYAEYGRTAH
ncbi:MAG: methyltransferase domain-containing protein [Sideroxyarcus sp.]|nr:methyltransferase domain-containing protein [Sideroxyarcus sp.]